MKNVKKIITLILLAMITSFSLVFVACSPTENSNNHTHAYGETWVYDEYTHWQQCTVCGEKSPVAGFHRFVSGEKENGYVTYTCSVCGKTKTEYVGYQAEFDLDANVSVLIFDTRDITIDGTETATATAKDDRGNIVTDGSGEINFTVLLSEGYVIDDIVIDGEYGELINDPDNDGSADYYRITDIAGDLSVTVTSCPEQVKPGYEVNFVIPSSVTVTVFDTQDVSGSGLVITNGYTGTIYAKTKMGVLSKTGDGQVNFTVAVERGYEITGVSVVGTYNNLKNDPESDGSTDYYRITKVNSDITVTISVRQKETFSITYRDVKTAENGNPTSYLESDTVTLTPLDDITGYKFVCWLDENGDEITAITSDSKANRVITAQWAIDGYTVNFVIPSFVTVTVFDTQDVSGTGIALTDGYTDTIYAKTETGVISKTGSEQVNFVITATNGYILDGITAIPIANFDNIYNDPESDGSANYYRITNIAGDITVTISVKRNAILTVNDLSKTYDGESVIADYTTNSDGAVTVLYKPYGADDSEYTETAPKNAGEYVIKVKVAETDNFYSVSETAEFTISKASSESLLAIPEGLAVYQGQKLSSINLSTYCLYWDNGDITVNETGVFTATFIPEDTINYLPISGVEITVSVVTNLIDIPSLVLAFQYDGTEKSVSVSNIANYDGSEMSIKPTSVLSATNAGEYEIVISINDGLAWSDNTTADITLTWTIEKIKVAFPTVSTSLSFDFDGTEKAVSFGYNSDRITQSGTLTATNAGNYAVTFSLRDKDNYIWADKSVTNKSFTWTINRAVVELPAVSDTEFDYDGNEHSVTINYDDTLITLSGTVSATAVGDYTINFSLKNTDNYAWADGTEEDISYTWNINKVYVPEPVVTDTVFTYDGNEHSVSVDYNQTLLTLTGTLTATDAGTYTITFSLPEKTGNYAWADETYFDLSYTWKISKKQVAKPTATITVFVYDGNEKSLSLSDYNAEYMIMSGNVSATAVGVYTATFSLKNENYCWSDNTTANVSIDWSITALSVSIPTVTNNSLTYTGSVLSPKVNYDTSRASVKDGSTVSAVNKGTYTITFTLKDSVNTVWSDGTTADKSYSWTIAQTTVSIPILSVEYEYDGTEKTISTSDITGYNAECMQIASGSTLSAVTAGNYDITVVLKDKTNYSWADGTTADKVLTWTIKTTSVSYPFTITFGGGTDNVYTITKDDTTSEYTIYFGRITADTTYTISGTVNGNVFINADPNESYKFTLVLSNVEITSAYNSPIYVSSASKVVINAAQGTVNIITDNRATVTSEEEKSAAIYSEIDLNLSGKGTLTIVSANNNGVHTKDKLEIKNVTLTVTCVNNALKGNDEVEIQSGTITLTSTYGDGIKTSNNGLSSKGNQKGSVTITGGNVTIYCAGDGISAAYNADISGDGTVVSIYTTSEYAGSRVKTLSSVVSGTYYIMASSSYSYKYSVRYKTSSGYTMVNADTTASKTASNYKYFAVDTIAGATSFEIYVYTSAQTQGSITTYYAKSSSKTLSASYDTIKTTISGTTVSTSLSLYQTSSSDNSDKLVYSAKGIKADNEILIVSGTVTVYAYDDALHANGDETIESTGTYGSGNVTLSGGTINIKSHDDGIHADGTLSLCGATVTVITAYEGIEATIINVSDGTTTVTATDDGVNASSQINVSGGRLDVTVSPGDDTDGIDSNGSITVTGGIIITRGPNNQNMCPLDASGDITLSGGTIIIIGYAPGGSSSGGSTGPGGRPGGFGPGGGGISEGTLTVTNLTKTQSSSAGLSQGSHTVTVGGVTISYTNAYSYSGYTTVYGSGTATVS